VRTEKLRLTGVQRAKYFAPVALCAYLATLCAAICITAVFLHNPRQAAATLAAGLFGLLLSATLGGIVLFVQLNEMRYLTVTTRADATTNFEAVHRLAQQLGWQITLAEVGSRLEVITPESMSQEGEIVSVQLRQNQVLVASICNPDVGFSLTGRRRCQRNRELVQQAVLSLPNA
jgi:hypothetical protein